MGVRYGTSEAVTIAYTPKGDLFSREELNKLGALRDELLAINRVESVDSILNVPIFEDTPLTGISEDYLTLADQDIDLVAAREEVTSSPVFRNAVISPDGQTAGMLVSFSIDETARDLIGRRTELRNKARSEELSADQASELAQVEADYAVHSVSRGRSPARDYRRSARDTRTLSRGCADLSRRRTDDCRRPCYLREGRLK